MGQSIRTTFLGKTILYATTSLSSIPTVERSAVLIVGRSLLGKINFSDTSQFIKLVILISLHVKLEKNLTQKIRMILLPSKLGQVQIFLGMGA